MKIAKRITDTSKKSFGMYEKSTTLSGDNSDLIHLELGRPDADTPQLIKDATIAALLAGEVHYSDMRGLAALREAIAQRLRTKNKIAVEADEVLITNGLTHASFATFMALLDEGDEVILISPHYPQHIGKIELAGANTVFAPLDPENGFRIERARVEAFVTPRTRMIVIVNPCNPTGRVFGRDELQAIADIAIAHDLVVVSDEVYEDIVYGPETHISVASLPGMKERTVSLFAYTKSFAMDGWRLGYIAAPKEIMPALIKITSNDVTHVNTFIQAGALAAIQHADDLLPDLVGEDGKRRDLVVDHLNAMPGVSCPRPAGTIYAFADIRATGLTSQEVADKLMLEARVVVVAGSFYGEAGEGFIRVCFGAQPVAVLEVAMTRMHDLFAQQAVVTNA